MQKVTLEIINGKAKGKVPFLYGDCEYLDVDGVDIDPKESFVIATDNEETGGYTIVRYILIGIKDEKFVEYAVIRYNAEKGYVEEPELEVVDGKVKGKVPFFGRYVKIEGKDQQEAFSIGTKGKDGEYYCTKYTPLFKCREEVVYTMQSYVSYEEDNDLIQVEMEIF